MSFEDVLRRSTVNPARVINRVEGLGTLAVGSPADIALLEIIEEKIGFEMPEIVELTRPVGKKRKKH